MLLSTFEKDRQIVTLEDFGFPAGYFHNYNCLQIGERQNQPRKVHIFLPRDYESSYEHYPVVYMNDGDTAFFQGGLIHASLNMAQILYTLYEKDVIHKVIVVAIYPIERNHEYIHSSVWGYSKCGLEEYSNYVATSVKRFVDNNYRTLAEPEHNLILGSSHGGLAAFYISNSRPDAFKFVGALSPSFWVGVDFAPKYPYIYSTNILLRNSLLLKILNKTLSTSIRRPKIYLDWGLVRSGGNHNSCIEERATARGREMVKILIQDFGYKLNQDLFIYEDPKGEHNEHSWSRRVPNLLRLFVGK
ncbi:MAG: alpha/beta hydrolase-fold protein [Candidatus Competibacteraceae bacterium]